MRHHGPPTSPPWRKRGPGRASTRTLFAFCYACSLLGFVCTLVDLIWWTDTGDDAQLLVHLLFMVWTLLSAISTREILARERDLHW